MVGDDLKEEVKKLVHTAIDLKFTIFNENVFYQVARLKERSDLNTQQKITSVFSLLVPEVKKITDQRPRVADYYKTETSVSILESISTDEIIILKKKLKAFALDAFAELPKKNLPGFGIRPIFLKEPFKLVLDLIDTIFEPESIKNAFDIFKNVVESTNGNYGLEFLLEKALEGEKSRLKELLIRLTNHFNKLVVGIPNKQISPTETETVLNRIGTYIQQVLPSTPPPESPENPNPMSLLSLFKKHLESEEMKKKFLSDKVEVITKHFSPSKKEKTGSIPKSRLTHFKGTVIAQKNKGQISHTFSVLRDSKGSDKLAIRNSQKWVDPNLTGVRQKLQASYQGKIRFQSLTTEQIVKERFDKVDKVEIVKLEGLAQREVAKKIFDYVENSKEK
ncbi:4405_t:CDS:2 [Ambispora leptoticha]|uniref:4405_t:CDS:1 n=1 Tax=Ambispora leptoticha TaxID=144679 RepID=A0A9N9EWN4_9GLOM|nr:4405_t:CDS:2 [Ambispora leptoticha]